MNPLSHPRIITLTAGPAALRIDPDLGGRISSLRVNDQPLLLEKPGESSTIPELMYGCFLMAPWVGRLRGGTFNWTGEHRFPLNLATTAIHGLVASSPWKVEDIGSGSLYLSLDLASTGWPFAGWMAQKVELRPDSLTLTARIEADSKAFPAALGWHPWFHSAPTSTLLLSSSRLLELDSDLLPTGATRPVGPKTDLRHEPMIAGRQIDDVYLDPEPPVVLTVNGLVLEISWKQPFNCAVVYVTDYAVCVEPQTAWPDAFNLQGTVGPACGLTVVAPEQPLTASHTWSWRLPTG